MKGLTLGLRRMALRLLFAAALLSEAAGRRLRVQPAFSLAAAPAGVPAAAPAAAPAGPHVQVSHDGEPVVSVLNKTDLTLPALQSCICPLGQFWDDEGLVCEGQLDWGSECSPYTPKLQPSVCQDGMMCKVVPGAKNFANDRAPEPNALVAPPAVCLECKAADSCTVGSKRHLETCVKEVGVEGKACVAVRVTLPKIRLTVNSTQRAQVTEEATKEFPAKAHGAANETVKVQIAATKTVNSTGSSSSHKEVDIDIKETFKANATRSAEKTMEHSAVYQGVGEALVCIEADKSRSMLADKKFVKADDFLAQKMQEIAAYKAHKEAVQEAIELALKDGMAKGRAEVLKQADQKALDAAMAVARAEAKKAAESIVQAVGAKAIQEVAQKRANEMASKAAKEEAEKAARQIATGKAADVKAAHEEMEAAKQAVQSQEKAKK